jgi:hypothetical protein
MTPADATIPNTDSRRWTLSEWRGMPGNELAWRRFCKVMSNAYFRVQEQCAGAYAEPLA